MPHESDQAMMCPPELTWLLHKGIVAQLLRESSTVAHMLPFLPLVQDMTA
jgi:hypothetical protein